MSSKGQIAGQIIVYILAIVVFSLVLVYGYNAIQGFRQNADQVLYINFKTDFTSMVNSLSTDKGSEKKMEFSLPSEFREVCFVAKDGSAGNNEIVKDAASPQSDNVFLIKYSGGVESFKAGPLTFSFSDSCQDLVDGKLKVKLTGEGNAARVSGW